ncbi:protein-methionine-sulfoxide reductase heme-binding subunit MsrQ [Amaricoccus macauensis]|uniref:protein-methionine-sulfoxide reductase heme-binding subunit MsrQ n=1 Tax=Amaricoccus macauensis TaxID=57001 RepID=UPI003C7E16A2
MIDFSNTLLRKIPAWILYALGVIPAVVLWGLGLQNHLGPDPVKALEHEFGLLSLQFLIAALAIRPLREVTGLNLMRFRRAIGLMAFFYAAMHFFVWLAFDRQLDWPRILEDLTKRPFIIVGFAAFLILVPLAVTSNNLSNRRLGGEYWRKLHRLAYAATALAAVHFVWLVKAWPPEPLIYAAIVASLLLYRAIPRRFLRGRGLKMRPGRGVEKKLS